MSKDRFAATLTSRDIADLLRASGIEPQTGSPLDPFKGVTIDPAVEPSPDSSAFGSEWSIAFSVLAAPDRQIRAVIPGPSETLVQVFYGSRTHLDLGLVGCWVDGDGLRVTFPWSDDEVASITTGAVLETPPPIADEGELSLSIGGLEALAASVDAMRERVFSSMSSRDPKIDPRFNQDDVRSQLETGAESADARWIVTLLRILSPSHVGVSPEAVTAGFEELIAAGVIVEDDGEWTPGRELIKLATWWRSPLPAVAHEVIEVVDGQMQRYDHRITIRGDGPLVQINYRDLTSDAPSVTISSVGATACIESLAEFLAPGIGGSQEWVYVLDPTEVLGLRDTSATVGTLLPGQWYILLDSQAEWVRVADPDGPLDGWVSANRVRRQSDAVEQETRPSGVRPAPTVPNAWEPTHAVPNDGMPAWANPDPAGQVVATLSAGIGLLVVERRGDWARVSAENAWEGWVDGRRLAAIRPVAVRPAPMKAAPSGVPVTGTRPVEAGWVDADKLRGMSREIGAVVAIVLSSFLPWFGGGASAFDIPVAFVLTSDPYSGGPSLGLFILVVALLGVPTLARSELQRFQLAIGGTASAVSALFFAQLLRLLTDDYSPPQAVGSLLTDSFGLGPWILLAAGVFLTTRTWDTANRSG